RAWRVDSLTELERIAGRVPHPSRGAERMSGKSGINLGDATENTVALNPIVCVAREDLIGAVGVMLRETAGRPMRTLKHMKNFSGEVVKILRNTSDLAPDPKDRRFVDPAWRTNPLYRAGMQYYLAVRKGMKDLIDEAEFDDL